MKIDLIVPNMALYGNPEMMLLIKTVNQLIKQDLENARQFNDLRNKNVDLEKEVEYLKKAQRNLY
jgi:hypothetical protein